MGGKGIERQACGARGRLHGRHLVQGRKGKGGNPKWLSETMLFEELRDRDVG